MKAWETVYGTVQKPVNQQLLAGRGPIPYGGRMIRPFQAITPTIPTSCLIEKTGIVLGDVGHGEHCSVPFHAVICGDLPHILIFSIPLEGEEVASRLRVFNEDRILLFSFRRWIRSRNVLPKERGPFEYSPLLYILGGRGG